MQIAKKAALLAATVGSLALLGTGTAAAHDGTGHEVPPPPVSVQSCSVTTGDITITNGDVTTGDVGDDSPVANNTLVISVSCFNTTDED
ncbi:hypothetical protein [Streptomyces botrytidirepellens]|uniref:Secreted protein n=1 Tax=Streptomyces botrytidirepellens TaxID=2486417 RepID=A0A3M8WBU5_9ACTN|nr:hypothetical protein [Streptomyces botrytidirepellens]RNG26960.1 hypothetical protein EEJ42_13865 [Streptomyces botrytidirepellens]